MDLLRRQSSVQQLNGKLKAVILIGGPQVGRSDHGPLSSIYGLTCMEVTLMISSRSSFMNTIHVHIYVKLISVFCRSCFCPPPPPLAASFFVSSLCHVSFSLFRIFPLPLCSHFPFFVLSLFPFALYTPFFSFPLYPFLSASHLLFSCCHWLRYKIPPTVTGAATTTFSHCWVTMVTTSYRIHCQGNNNTAPCFQDNVYGRYIAHVCVFIK